MNQCNIDRLPCVNQLHLMQIMDRWGFARVLHYASPGGMQCAVYCHAVADGVTASRDMCLAVISANGSGEPIRLQEITGYVQNHYKQESHPPLRNSTEGVTHTPNAGSRHTFQELGRWCDTVTDALTRFHVLVNQPVSKKRKKDG